MRLHELIAFVLETADALPERIHAREVWHDEIGGSLLHAPAWSGEMRDLIEGSPFRTARGQSIWEDRYRRPQHAADQRLARSYVPDGLPRFDVVLRALRQCQGSVGATLQLLATTWPKMGSPAIALPHIAEACRRYRGVYRDEPRVRELRVRSDSQLDAEAAA